MNKSPSYTYANFVADILHYISPYKWRFLVGIFFRLTSDLAQLYPVWALSQIVVLLSRLNDPQTGSTLIFIFVTWGLAALYHGLTHNLAKYLGYQVAESAALDLFKDCLGHIFLLDLSWQESENSGNKMKRIDKGRDGMDEVIRRIFDVLIEVSVNTIGIVIIFSTLQPMLSISLIFFIISYYLLGNYLIKRAVKQEEIVSAQFENLNGLTFEALNNIHTIKALAIDQSVLSTVTKQVHILIQEIYRRILWFRFRSGFLSTYEHIFQFVVICAICWGIWQGQVELSLLVLFVGLFQKVSESTRELTDVTQQIIVAKIWISRAMGILRLEPTIDHPQKRLTQLAYPNDWQELRVKNLHFNYKKGQALENISFTIKRGQQVGIVGLSGAGKSTLFKLLLDLYENYEGEIYLDHLPLKQMNRQLYVDHLAVVLQDTELFNMSLKENITLAATPGSDYSDAKLNEAIQMAHLEDVVAHLPNGVDTVVGEKGVKLSGGQRQRVGIARALYRQPDILLLDEATSHLDAHSERQIQEALHGFIHKFTTVVIAHRLSTIKEMDKIIVLNKGKVVEEGTFDELIKKRGAFAKMWKEQKI